MQKKISRRELAKLGGIAALTMLAPTLPAQENVVQDRVDLLDKQLAKPLSGDARKLAEAALKNIQNLETARRKHKLPENSEPCTVYVVSEAKR